jgi:hypothetical protein
VPKAFYQIASFSAEHVDIARMGIPLQNLLHLQRQSGHTAAHVRMTGGDPDPNVCRDRDQRNPFNVAATGAAGAFAVRLTRAPPDNSTTIA